MSARTRQIYLTLLVAVGLAAAVRMLVLIRSDRLGEASTWGAALVVIGIGVAAVAVVVGRVRGLAAHVARHRPDAVVVPAYATGQTADEARAVGATARGIWPMGGTPIALAATADGDVEVWAGRDAAPRWRIRPTPQGITTAPAVYGSRTVTALVVRDGSAGITVVPAYRPLPAMGGHVPGDVTRAAEQIAGVLEKA